MRSIGVTPSPSDAQHRRHLVKYIFGVLTDDRH